MSNTRAMHPPGLDRGAPAIARFGGTVALVALLGLGGCAAPAPDQELQDLATAGSANFHSDFSVFLVPSGDPDVASQDGDAGTEPSEMSRQLAQHFANAETQDVSIVVGGPESATTAAVVVGAAGLLEGQSLGKLRVLFIGDARDAAAVHAAIESIGGSLQFAAH